MSDQLREEIPEIVDLDKCSKKKSILIGAAATCALSVFPLFPLLNIIVGSALAVGFFTKTYAISVKKRVGAKIGMISVALGTALIFPISGQVRMVVNLTDPEFAAAEKEKQVKALYEQGSAQFAQFFEANFPEKIEESQLFLILGVMFVFAVILTAFFGAIFGAISAIVFKKGPQAQ